MYELLLRNSMEISYMELYILFFLCEQDSEGHVCKNELLKIIKEKIFS
jgi:hypothetical protein